MFIRVTERDIALGDKGNTFSCPLARAIRRRANPKYGVQVSRAFAYFNNKSKGLSTVAFDFVGDFDKGKPVKPGIYWI